MGVCVKKKKGAKEKPAPQWITRLWDRSLGKGNKTER